MPEHKEKVGEMEKSTAAVSVIQTLADFSERQKQQLRKWSIGVSQSSSERVLETLQVALGYQLHILTMCQKCHDINSALLLMLIKSMMSLRYQVIIACICCCDTFIVVQVEECV